MSAPDPTHGGTLDPPARGWTAYAATVLALVAVAVLLVWPG